MTTPQSGREAFEALVETWRSEVERGTGYLNDESDRAILACADELEAALAQQGREVVYQCPRCATSMQIDPTAKPYVAPKQQAVEVTEDMVRRALHFCPSEQSSPRKWRWIAKFITTELLAALAGKTEVDRG